MNLMKAAVVDQGGAICAQVGSALLPLGRWSAGELAPSQGQVLVGIRPEELGLVDAAAAAPNTLRGVVSAIEPLGAETLIVVDLESGAGEVTARVHRDVRLALGEPAALGFAASALYLFDGRTEKAVLASGT